MDFGHGFIPRIDARNAAGVDRAVGVPGQPTLEGVELRLPLVIAEGAWAATRPALLNHLKACGGQVLVDTSAWRFREPTTFSMAKYRATPYFPREPLHIDDEPALRHFVRQNLLAQYEYGATALLIPGFLPRHVGDEPSPMTRIAIDEALSCRDLPPLPLVAFVGSHSLELEKLIDFVADLHRGVSALYVQCTPVAPLHDSTSKLTGVVDALEACEREGFPVIGGHLGAISPLLRTCGVSGADAGLGQTERFSTAAVLRPTRQRSTNDDGKWAGPRIYAGQLGRSLAARSWRALLGVPDIKGRMRCTDLCCRFRTLDTTITRAIEHSLHGRVADAQAIAAVPAALRFDAMTDRLEQQRSFLAKCNTALAELGESLLSATFLDHHLGVVARRLDVARRSA